MNYYFNSCDCPAGIECDCKQYKDDTPYIVDDMSIIEKSTINGRISKKILKKHLNRLEKAMSKLEAENKILRGCAEFYGDEENWEEDRPRSTGITCDSKIVKSDIEEVAEETYVGGKTARETLKKADEVRNG
jgi:hypothetical protein